jgi:hypothetical protein
VAPDAAWAGREAGIVVIEGGCPLMYEPASDGAHKLMRRCLGLFGATPIAG